MPLIPRETATLCNFGQIEAVSHCGLALLGFNPAQSASPLRTHNQKSPGGKSEIGTDSTFATLWANQETFDLQEILPLGIQLDLNSVVWFPPKLGQVYQESASIRGCDTSRGRAFSHDEAIK